MPITNVTDQLKDIRFFTPLDPYHYSVDNRPLSDLDSNIRLIAEASDASSGAADRSALAAATSAYALLGYGETVSGDPIRQSQGMFSANYNLSGLQIDVTHGYMVFPQDRGGSPAYIEPRLAVHDAITPLVVQSGRGGTVQVKYRESTVNDRISSGSSSVLVAEVSFKQGSGPSIFPQPDAGAIAIMQVDVPSGVSALSEDHITLVNMKTVSQTSRPIKESKLSYIDHTVTLSSGLQNISLTGTDIDTDNIEAVQVFTDGVNQFNWTYNSGTNNIVLESPLTESAAVRIRQLVISL